ncbi:inositol-tetrakisphosphate 1-kinase 3 isoform X2 [Andrographis paniculata]|uniref:inositol-tetrakisphosphate 1-kinase 3 isoform X2 n=1 Tax=Andrographis paniculata TaxID=175694 RepID=UPI0021E7875F|nr:inositol-tetrakisphosphate 1-kinase 3 isoform X2 [Andrographis paniculata]
MRMRGLAYGVEEEEMENEVRLEREGNDENENEKLVAQRRYAAVAAGGGFSPPSPMKSVVVGYALTSKKVKSFLQPKLEGLARKKGILFVAIDHSKPLADQGPFDIVLHKLSGKEWRRILEEYRETHPSVTVLDPPDAIQHLHNRQSMLQAVADMNLFDSYGQVSVPKQLVIKKDPSSIADAVNKAALKLPIGGVLFKVYIVGETVKVVRRFSLPDVNRLELSNNAGVYHFPRVSCAAASADDADLDPCVAELPPRPLLERLARGLRHRLGLRLFNLDIIRKHGTRDNYYVIDINYFPGYGKIPEYEHVFTDFLLSLVQGK